MQHCDHVGQRVLALRTHYGWTRSELARQSGLHVQHLVKIAQGRRVFLGADTRITLALALQCTTDALLGLTEAPSGETPLCLEATSCVPARVGVQRGRCAYAMPRLPPHPNLNAVDLRFRPLAFRQAQDERIKRNLMKLNPFALSLSKHEWLKSTALHPNLPPPGGKENKRDMHFEKSPCTADASTIQEPDAEKLHARDCKVGVG